MTKLGDIPNQIDDYYHQVFVMVRLSRLADYGVVLMSHMAESEYEILNAQSMAEKTGVPLPTVSKVLFALGRAGLLIVVRGPGGGFKLARNAQDISVAEIVGAVDGPIALTQCIKRGPGTCEVERFCRSRRGWQTINDAVRRVFEDVSLADLVAPYPDPWAAGMSNKSKAKLGTGVPK